MKIMPENNLFTLSDESIENEQTVMTDTSIDGMEDVASKKTEPSPFKKWFKKHLYVKNGTAYILMVPAIVYLIVFCYAPL